MVRIEVHALTYDQKLRETSALCLAHANVLNEYSKETAATAWWAPKDRVEHA